MPGASRKGFSISLRSTLLLLVVGLLLVTVLTIGVVSFVNSAGSIDRLTQSLANSIAQGATAKVNSLFTPVESALMENRHLAERGMLDLDDPVALGERLAARLRQEPGITWLSYSDQQGRFTGVWRDEHGRILLNRSWFVGDKVHLVEEELFPDGRRDPVRHSKDHKYDPRQRPFYQPASESKGVVWMGPYSWFAENRYGVTAAAALRRDDKLLGVFTADFDLNELSRFINDLKISKSAEAYLLDTRGSVVVGAPGKGFGDLSTVNPVLRHGLEQLSVRLDAVKPGEPQIFVFSHNGVRYGLILAAIDLPGNQRWVLAMHVEMKEAFGFVGHGFLMTLLIGLTAVAAAIVAAFIISRRISRSLAQVADDLERAGRFELTADRMPRTYIREVRVVGETTNRMKASLRSFSRYVPASLVRELMSRGEEAVLGMTEREMTVYFSDIEGFTRMCEVVPPNKVIEMGERYFTMIEETIHKREGTVDKFLGDGVMAFFNAPHDVPYHAAAACAAALEIQAALPAMRSAFGQTIAMPPTRTRIGIHTGPALVGNMGSLTRMNYTVIGDTVNVASGFETLNKLYHSAIITGQTTRDAAVATIEFRMLDHVKVKTRDATLYIYEPLGFRGKVADQVLRARDAYERALAHYFEGRFDQAASLFEQALGYNPADKPAAVLLARVRAYTDRPPPADWAGVFDCAGVFAKSPTA